MGVSLAEQADTGYYVTDMGDVTHQVNHPPTCTSGYLPALKVFLLAGLLICHSI